MATADGAQHGAEVQLPTNPPSQPHTQSLSSGFTCRGRALAISHEHWQKIMQHNSTDGVIITYDTVQ